MKKVYLLVSLLAIAAVYGQTPPEREWIKSHYDLSYLQNLAKIKKAEAKEHMKKTLELAAIYNWPLTYTDSNGNFNELVGLQADNKPNYYTTNNHSAAISTRTDHLNTGGSLNLGLDADNMYVAIWDERFVFADHLEFQSRVTIQENYMSVYSPHATHVTGTILAAGLNASAKGMAPKATASYYAWDNDYSEAIVEAMYGLLVSNHSYGTNPENFSQSYIGNYQKVSQDWDKLMHDAPYYLMVTSAGNEGFYNNTDPMPGAGSEYDKLYGFKTAKNNLVIANAYEPILNANGDFLSASMYPTSSTGPTDDLRIKPDITGNGTNIFSTSTTNPYSSMTGTSMACPNVSGTLLLLQQYRRNLSNDFMRAATLKGLVLHTADDILPVGPDAHSGWGLLNAKRAAETMKENNYKSLILENSLSNSENHSFEILSDGINPLSVSISWTDLPGDYNELPPSNNPTPKLVNNLNLNVSKGTSTFYPYLLTSPSTSSTGINNVDPFEKVDIQNASGYYTINIDHAGTIQGNTPQLYTLIITGAIICSPAIDISQNVISGKNDIRYTYQHITAHNTIEPGAEANYRAANYINLTDGFVAKSGSYVLAEINSCNPILSQLSGNRTAMSVQGKDNEINETIAKKVIIYPNPASGSVTLKITQGTINTISIISIDGKHIKSNVVKNTSEKLDISLLDKGIYLISVETDLGEIITEKLIIE